MHILTVNSVNSLLNYLTDKLKRTPSADVIQKWITEEKPDVTDKKVYSDKIKKIHRTAFIEECLLCILCYFLCTGSSRNTQEISQDNKSLPYALEMAK